ncbi:ACP S-malonyltransferase [Variovorax sp. WS11]|uniref:acyltransferase domain-containing protein n=1 Tax=Variovorax sp. WS11 TaxID=1105204 RepID=UPI000D0E033B|nr:acyltransferase domain-containing protein [Variovorax sp. WS11]NDZ18669.1 acyltransferase domain-containing protein [Variovorax sp. WS11]PSL83620.1 ACP S-malonyltransferase [Variovorax sp. WS11]
MSFALLFSGQGNQHPAMLPWIADDAIVDDMRTRLGVEDWRRALADPGWAERNDNAQTLLTGLALAAWSQLAPLVAPPAAIAGYSVGELPAFSAGGVLEPAATVELARRRAEAMDECAARAPGGLLAVSGLSRIGLERLRAQTGLALAIRNGEDSVILGGPIAALVQAQPMAEHEGAQCTRLRVNVASHTPWMREAADRFSRTLENVRFHAPRVVLFSNAADRIRDASSARFALAAQIATTVRWDECMENVMGRQVRCVLEIGPGQALARMWSQRYPSVPARACDDFRSAAAIAAWLNSHAD